MGNKLIRFVDSSKKSILFLRRQFLSCFLDISSHQKEKSAQREGKRKQEIKGHSPERNTRHKEKEQESGLNSNAIGQKQDRWKRPMFYYFGCGITNDNKEGVIQQIQ